MKSVRRIVSISVLLGGSLAISLLGISCSSDSDLTSIAIVKYQTTEWMNTVQRGFVEELSDSGLVDGESLQLSVYSADGEDPLAAQIARRVVSQHPDLVMSISTPMTQKMRDATSEIPVVFGAITDPVSAKIVNSEAIPGGNLTGTSDKWPVESQLKLVQEIVPEATRIGLVFNPGEANTMFNIEQIREAAPKLGLTLVEASASSTSEVGQAARSLVGRADVIFIPACNTAITAAPAIFQVGANNHIPVFAGEPSSVERGAVATYSLNYEDIGRLTARMALRILHGASPSSLPVATPTDFDLIINSEAARTYGIDIPADIIANADMDYGHRHD